VPSSASSSPSRSAAAVVVAAGSGSRMGAAGAGGRKQYLEIEGEPVLLRALRPFLHHPAVAATVVVLPPADLEHPPAWLLGLPILLVAGGAERGDSVWNGLRRVPASCDAVLIHDGARPFVTAALIDRVLQRAWDAGAITALPVTDTIKEVDETGRVVRTPERAGLWQAQTPQGFPRAALLAIYGRAREEGVLATDDASLFERYGLPVHVVAGDPENIKITRPLDLVLARALARGLPGRRD
jgi:2-C-methyl-D-erythritol 4-phosphate cytidylyltransferase